VRVIIVGAGAIGTHLAGRLSREEQDVVLIEVDEVRAAELQESLDALVITGNGAGQAVLRDAGVEDAELLIAVSNSDGANVLACHNAHELGVTTTIARVQDPSLREGLHDLGVDVVIDPEDAAARELVRLVRRGGLSEIDEFAGGELVLVGGVVAHGALLDGARVSEQHGTVRGSDWVVVAVGHGGAMTVVRRDTVVEADDRVFIMTTRDGLDRALRLIGERERPIRRTLIVGSTRLAGIAVERMAAEGLKTVVLDHEEVRCRRMAQEHPGSLVVRADPTDPMVYGEQQVGPDDAVLALTGWDEVNVMSCLVGKAMGAGLSAARFQRLDHVELLDGVGIDATVSGRVAAANEILRYVRGEHVFAVAAIKHAEAEALEIEVSAGATAAGRALRELDLPESAVIGGVLRDGRAFVPGRDATVEAGDHLVVFSLPDAIGRIERMLTR
jgi:trk system potassium uptake protein